MKSNSNLITIASAEKEETQEKETKPPPVKQSSGSLFTHIRQLHKGFVCHVELRGVIRLNMGVLKYTTKSVNSFH